MEGGGAGSDETSKGWASMNGVRKKHDLCQVFMCLRKTWSGKPEKNLALRYCIYHEPTKAKEMKEAGEKLGARNKRAVPKKPPSQAHKNPFFMPLICLYRAYQHAGNDQIRPTEQDAKIVFVTVICGKIAPRRSTGDRSKPKFPSRTGEPLCRHHACYADDENAFPGEPDEGFVNGIREEAMMEIERMNKERLPPPDDGRKVEF